MAAPTDFDALLGTGAGGEQGGSPLHDVQTSAPGPQGALPLTEDMLLNSPSGDLFALSQNVGMGWHPDELNRPQVLILSTQGGIRAPDGTPIALGYHTGHWEVGLLDAGRRRGAAWSRRDALRRLLSPTRATAAPRAPRACSTACPTATTPPQVFRRLIRSLPTRHGVIGVATCDKGLPAMMMALAGTPDLPCVLVPGGVTLPPTSGEDAGKVQSIGARFAHGETLARGGRRPGLSRVRLARRRLPVSRHRRYLAGRRRGAGPGAAALGAGAIGPADLARAGARLGPRAAADARAGADDPQAS